MCRLEEDSVWREGVVQERSAGQGKSYVNIGLKKVIAQQVSSLMITLTFLLNVGF